MGMFDYITIDNKWLPEDARRPYDKQEFQTKSLEDLLYKYDIMEDGKLVQYFSHEDGESFNHVKYTGEITFYDFFEPDYKRMRYFKAWCVDGFVKEVIETT